MGVTQGKHAVSFDASWKIEGASLGAHGDFLFGKQMTGLVGAPQ
jgi:hypothetical protein